MKMSQSKQLIPIILVIVLTLLGAWAIIRQGPPSTAFLSKQQLNKAIRDKEEGASTLVAATQGELVKRYIKAYQMKNCDDVCSMTWWIQERMEKINKQYSDDLTRIEQEKAQMCDNLFAVNPKESTVDLLGLDDQYLLGSMSVYTVIGADPGRMDIEKKVKERVWVKFVYSNPQTAPKLKNNPLPVHSIVAGVNISEDNYILKGSVRGNWEVDLSSISTKW